MPLPDKAYELAAKRVGDMKTGTVFGGKESIGMKIDELFERELKQ